MKRVFGTAFKQLSCADDLWLVLKHILKAETWQARERYLAEAYEYIAAMHNALNLTEPMPEQTIPFHGRPFRVIELHGFADALVQQIQDSVVRQIAEHPLIGGIDQFSDSTDLVSNPIWRPVLKQLYQ